MLVNNIQITLLSVTVYEFESNPFFLLKKSSNLYLKLEVERTSKNRTSNIPNLRGSNFEHIQTSHLGPKPNFEPLEHHQKPNCSRTLLIKNGPNFFQNLQNWTSNMSKHLILAKNQTSYLSNITKKQTVCEHWTVCSTSNRNIH